MAIKQERLIKLLNAGLDYQKALGRISRAIILWKQEADSGGKAQAEEGLEALLGLISSDGAGLLENPKDSIAALATEVVKLSPAEVKKAEKAALRAKRSREKKSLGLAQEPKFPKDELETLP